jgi:hypothetical protein
MNKTIIHVYKPGNFGFADFIRAIYSISNIANINNYIYKVAFNHPISDFFDIDNTNYETTVRSYPKLLELVKQNTELIILETNHIDPTVPIEKNIIQKYIKPKKSIIESFETKMEQLKIKKKQYVVFHIRVGDYDDENNIDNIDGLIKRIKQNISIIKMKNLPIIALCSKSFILHNTIILVLF